MFAEFAWKLVAGRVQDVLIALMHAQAFADHAGQGVDILERPGLAGLAAAEAFLAPVRAFLVTLRAAPLVVDLADTKPTDDNIEAAGAQMIHAILEPIGLRTVRADGGGRIVLGRVPWAASRPAGLP